MRVSDLTISRWLDLAQTLVSAGNISCSVTVQNVRNRDAPRGKRRELHGGKHMRGQNAYVGAPWASFSMGISANASSLSP